MRFTIVSLLFFTLVATGCSSDSESLQPPEPPAAESPAAESAADTAVSTADPSSATASGTRSASTERMRVAGPEPVASTNGSLKQRIADANAESRVIQALVKQDALRVFDFDATVHRGELTILGDVNTLDQHRLIDRVLRRISGVTSTANQVTVGGQPFDVVLAEAKQKGQPQAKKDSRKVFYTVRSGDTLWNIARQHAASVQQIKTINGINSASLQPGQRIRVR